MSFFILYANCIPVKGINRSLICDLQRNQYWYIPEGLYSILTTHLNASIADIKASYKNEFDPVIDEYFEFLIKNELGFLGTEEEARSFPRIDLTWDKPGIITNSIIDSNEFSSHDFSKIFNELEELGCKYIQLRFYATIPTSRLNDILDHLANHRIISVEIILPFQSSEISSQVEDLFVNHKRLTQVVFFGSPDENSYVRNHVKVINITSKINSELHCGAISSQYFTINMDTFSESTKYNTCLNRKISIDARGEIKNCPSLFKSYGNIINTSLVEVLLKGDVKELWEINKDKIEVCKDCEFRHICTDCRAYLEQPENLYSKPLKCGYNPHTCRWDDWSENPLKKQVFEKYSGNSI